ncbi:MAG: hypothetical protein K2X27_00250, partial [Candidatus Obscuribacterales bacterium]|nr:hypothetical protein [Candidatus Obscuribacterales bacterium]
MTTLLSLFLLGPLLGLVSVAVLSCVPRYKWQQQRFVSWSCVAGTVLAQFVLSSLLGTAALLTAVPVVLAYAAYVASKNDPSFERGFGKARSRGFAAAKVLLFGAPKADEPADDEAQFNAADFVKPQSQTAAPKPEAPAGGKAWWQKNDAEPQPVICPMPVKPLTEQQLLEALLQEVGRLQSWAARPEAERIAVAELTSQARDTETALNDAVKQLQNGTVN